MASGEQQPVDLEGTGAGDRKEEGDEQAAAGPRPNAYRDTWCGEVLGERVDSEARVAGWVHRRRDHGGLIFIDLRDRTGLVQLVFHPDTSGRAVRARPQAARRGRAQRRGEGGPPLATRRSTRTCRPGEFELAVADAELLSDADTPPFQIEGFSGEVGEDARLRHRYLDLRREQMREALELRHRVTAAMREFLDGEGFLDVETPVLTRSTPEGARDFLVPSRTQQGSFYALPQSPQLFKQLLMVGGFERYYQIARCFRDEDLRADRQPDFTQLDIEMSFVDGEDVIEVNERLLAHVFDRVGGPALEPADPADVLRRGDRPLRHRPARHSASGSSWSTSARRWGRPSSRSSARCSREAARSAASTPASREMPRSELDGLISRAQELGAKGLVWAFREGDGWRSPTAKFLSEDELADLNQRLGAEEGDLLLLVADKPQGRPTPSSGRCGSIWPSAST